MINKILDILAYTLIGIFALFLIGGITFMFIKLNILILPLVGIVGTFYIMVWALDRIFNKIDP